MNNADYWKQRFEQLEQAQNQKGVSAYAEIEKQYHQAQKQIEGQISKWYQRFADNNGISFAETRKYLKGADLKEFKWDVQEYIKYGQDNALMGGWVKELENASAKYHISKLEALKVQTQQSLEVMFSKQYETVQDTLTDVLESGYYHTAYELQSGFNVGWDIAGLDQAEIEAVLSKPWAADGYNFSERIWNNKNKLISEVHNELSRNILTGSDPQKAIDAIAKKMNTSKNNAGRLVMTEEAYFSSVAQQQCFEDLGVEQYEIVATLDSHTSDICRSLDGQHFPMSEYQAGVTAPPFHVNCRSTTVPYFDEQFDIGERAARDVMIGETYYVSDDMTYSEWKQMQDERYGEGSVDKTRKYIYSKSSDYQQYKRYTDRLGEKNVGSFEDFRVMKVENTESFHDMELRYRYKGVDNRLLASTPSYKVMNIEEGVPDEYNACARKLDDRSKKVIFKYTDGGEGCAEINTYAATGNAKTATTAQDVKVLHDALDKMYLAYDTVVFRGTKREYIDGLSVLENKFNLSDWKNKKIKTRAFSSTSLFRDTAYSGEVEMTILVPKNKNGAGYVNEISHHHLTTGFNDEYEVVLQNDSEYTIIESQYFKDKLFLVVEWLGG